MHDVWVGVNHYDPKPFRKFFPECSTLLELFKEIAGKSFSIKGFLMVFLYVLGNLVDFSPCFLGDC